MTSNSEAKSLKIKVEVVKPGTIAIIIDLKTPKLVNFLKVLNKHLRYSSFIYSYNW